MLIFDLQLFGGKGSKVTYQQAQVPAMSEEEKALLGEQLKWAQTTQPVAQGLLSMANNALSTQQVTPNPNWQTLYNNAQKQTEANGSLVQSLIPQVNGANADNSGYIDHMGASISSMTQGNKELGAEYDRAMQANSAGMSGLMNGVLPSSYAENRQKALQSDLTNTVGSTLSGLASRGIINSSQADSAFNDISRNASNTLASQYSNDMATAAGLTSQAYNNQLAGINGKAGLLGSTFNNQMSGYGQQSDLANQGFNNQLQKVSTLSQLANQSQQMAMDPIQTAATAQEASINVPMQYLSMATGQNAPTQNLLSQMSQQRYSVATPAQTLVRQGDSGFLGGLMSGLGSYLACFPAGTEVATPNGGVPIEQLGFGAEVITYHGVGTVQELHDMGEAKIYELTTPECSVLTTETQTVVTLGKGLLALKDLAVGDFILTVNGPEMVMAITDTDRTEQVYELELAEDLTSDCFYAGGILVEGLTAEDKDLIAKQAAEAKKAEAPIEEVPVSVEDVPEKKQATRRRTVKAGK